MNHRPKTLNAVLEKCWSLLAEGVSRRDSAMRTPVLGSLGERGCELRTVILRGCDRARRSLQCHTDARSPKVSEIQRCARLQWVFYHPESRVQLRATGLARVYLEGDWVDKVWQAQHPRSRLVYLIEDAPGTSSDHPTSGFGSTPSQPEPDVSSTEAGRINFAVIECRIDELDWLHLGVGVNTRAQFRWEGDVMEANWCVP